jgi:hypothetical protein
MKFQKIKKISHFDILVVFLNEKCGFRSINAHQRLKTAQFRTFEQNLQAEKM